MNTNIAFLPEPRNCSLLEDTFTLPAEAFILLDVPQPQAVLFTASRIQQALQAQTGYRWERTASAALPAEEIALTLRIDPLLAPHAEGYSLAVRSGGIRLSGHDEAGLFYGAATLIQLIAQAGRMLPCLQIDDWPDFPARGVMLDISRDKVYSMDTLYELVDRLAGWKINQVQLYIEHTFAYRNHKEVWEKASPLTAEEILDLDAYCRQRCIELVPNQNSFGHMARWLKFPRYADLAEKHGEFMAPWGPMMGPFGLAPGKPGSLELVKSLYDELLPNFSSKMFNVGCDETVDLGQGQSQQLVAEKGVGRVYLDFLQSIHADVTRRGYTMQFWGDIIVQHPDLVPELPKDAIGLLWGYEADHPFDKEGAQFAAAGIPFYVCPGTSSWNSIGGRTDNALGNLRSAAVNGLKHGAVGYLNTDWGDNGHWQMYPIFLLGLAAGAAYSWCYRANQDANIPQLVSRYAFDDRSGTMGKVAFDLGNAYVQSGITMHNSTLYHYLLQTPLDKVPAMRSAKPEILERALQAVNDAILPLAQERMARMDADLIRREFLFTARLMRHACYRGMLAIETDPEKVTHMSQQLTADIKEIIDEYRLLWAARNRPGGLVESAARLEKLKPEYEGKFLARFLEEPKENPEK